MDIDINEVVSTGGTIGVLVAWLITLRIQLVNLQKRYDNLHDEYTDYLKSDRQRQNEISAELRLGERLKRTEE